MVEKQHKMFIFIKLNLKCFKKCYFIFIAVSEEECKKLPGCEDTFGKCTFEKEAKTDQDSEDKYKPACKCPPLSTYIDGVGCKGNSALKYRKTIFFKSKTWNAFAYFT